jgi:hypothetical protein
MQDLNNIRRDTGEYEGASETLSCQGRLWRRLQQNGVARNDGRKNRIDRDKIRITGTDSDSAGGRSTLRKPHFQGAMTTTTPSGVRLMKRRKPDLSVSAKDTSERDEEAMESMDDARSRKPRASPGHWLTGLHAQGEYPCFEPIVVRKRDKPPHLKAQFERDLVAHILEFLLEVGLISETHVERCHDDCVPRTVVR